MRAYDYYGMTSRLVDNYWKLRKEIYIFFYVVNNLEISKNKTNKNSKQAGKMENCNFKPMQVSSLLNDYHKFYMHKTINPFPVSVSEVKYF